MDRGLFSVETISLLTCLKLRYPDRVQLIRGNHESRAVTQTYGFYTECTRKYGSPNVWTYFTDMFDFLTLSTVIDDQIFCVHGGLSPSVHYIDQVKIIDRFREIPHEGPMADLVWSDPDPDKEEFAISPRGAGFTFGSSVVKHFLARNNMSHILRAHQLCMEGFSVLYDDRLSTVWSAPNYCYRCGNLASILEVGPGGTKHFNTFEAAPENERDGPAQAAQAAQVAQIAQQNGQLIKVGREKIIREKRGKLMNLPISTVPSRILPIIEPQFLRRGKHPHRTTSCIFTLS